MNALHRHAWLLFAGLLVAATTTPLSAQNGTAGFNYHVLHNGLDVLYLGVGAGGAQTALDGIGVWIPGEDLKGSTRAAFSGDWAYKNPAFRETVCFLGPGPQPTNHIKLPLMLWLELDNRHVGSQTHGHNPAVFLHPTDPSCLGFPLGFGALPFGVPSGSTASFVLSSLPTGIPSSVPPGFQVLLPNEGLSLPSSHPDAGQATLIGQVAGVDLNTGAVGGCWEIQFTWLPTALASLDHVSGWWHYLANSPDGDQYWGFSANELSLARNNTVATDAGATVVQTFLAAADYCFESATVAPNTAMTLLPLQRASAYAHQTENVFGGNPNGGFDVGRGSRNISLSGTGGVDGGSGFGNQDPSQGGELLWTTLGFMTTDHHSHGGTGSERIIWWTLDTDYWAPGSPNDPALARELVLPGYGVRVPSPVPKFNPLGWPQGITLSGLRLFPHVTSAAPHGWPVGSGGGVGGASTQLLVSPGGIPVCIGVPLVFEYGSSATVGVGGPFLWDPALSPPSGAKEFFMLD